MIKSVPTSNISNAAKIEFGYSHGYTRALLEVKEQLTPEMYEDMKRHKVKFNVKNVHAVLDCVSIPADKSGGFRTVRTI